MKGWAALGLSVVCIGVACAGLGNASCSSNSDGDDDDTLTDSGTTQSCDGGPSYSGTAGQACVAPPATIPDPACDDAVQSGSANGVESLCPTTPPSPACSLSACQAASVAAGSCEPLANNPAAGPWNFRMRRLIVAAPPNLASTTIQNTVVTNGVDMNEKQCGEVGTGAFSWLISVTPDGPDAGTGTIKTGGAPPCDLPNPVAGSTPGTWSCDPFTTGYCFVNKTLGNLQIGPATGNVVKNCDGSWSTTTVIPTLNIPIYYQGNIITLPISNGAIEGMQISPDGNCVGSFNPGALNSDCTDQYTDCSKWKTDGALTGYITLETADTVKVDLLNESLCVVLTNSQGVPDATGFKYCGRNADGSIKYPGDYCSTTKAPGGCNDSFWLAATFAASAVNINDGTTSGPDGGPNLDCLGGGSSNVDAGTDSGTPASDAGSDASDAASD
jgi:hypothetical protein